MRPVPTCNGLEDKSLSTEVTSDIAVGARISFNICGEVQSKYGEEGAYFSYTQRQRQSCCCPWLVVTPSPSALGKDRRDTTHAVHLAVNIISPVRLSHAPRHLDGRNCAVVNGQLVFVQWWQFTAGSQTRRTAYMFSTVAVAE